MKDKTTYFNGLNGIRAFASIIVVIWHTDQFSNLFKLEKIGFSSNGMAGNAVDMFFVLSGFLITYLLIIEKNKKNTIDLKKFYIRRVLRIWPLYYLSIIISLLLIYFGVDPGNDSLTYSYFYYFFLLANIAYISKIAISTITPLWSVGVEEQFYLIWPNIMKRTSNYLKTFTILIIGYLLLKVLTYFVFTPSSSIFNFIESSRVDIMFLGAIGAYLVYSNHNILKYIYRKEIQVSAWSVLLISIIYKPIHIISFVDNEINAIFYFIIIINVASNKKTIITLENKLVNFIGQISYGIYVYHMIVIYILSYYLNEYSITINIITMYIMVITTTILLAWISYKYFETPFLKLKNRYTVVQSTNRNPSIKK